MLAMLFPEAKMICCVLDMPWILDSIERVLRENPLELSKISTLSHPARSIPVSKDLPVARAWWAWPTTR